MPQALNHRGLISYYGSSILGVLCLSLMIAPAAAQSGEQPAERSVVCFTSGRSDHCATFLVFETLLSSPLAQDSRLVSWESGPPDTPENVFDRELEWQFGPMINVGEHWALGGTIGFGTSSLDGLRTRSLNSPSSVTVRVRRWLHSYLAVDLSAGWIFRDPSRPGRNPCQPEVLSGACTFPQGRITGTRLDARLHFFDNFHGGVAWERLDISPYGGPTSADEGGNLDALNLYLGLGSESALLANGLLLLGILAFG